MIITLQLELTNVLLDLHLQRRLRVIVNLTCCAGLIQAVKQSLTYNADWK